MGYSTVAAILLAAILVLVTADQFYDGKWDKVDTRAIIDNDHAFKKYKECLMDPSLTGCPRESVDLGNILPEAIRERCAKCSPRQTEKIKDTLSYICVKRPNDFAEVIAKIDPENKHRRAFEEKLGKFDGDC